jgi:DNA-binding transcriptional regulator YdaS (Cro superfamily)
MLALPLWARVAVTATFVSVEVAKARQISAVPNCAFARTTRVQVKPPPLTPVTVSPAELASVDTNARSNSLVAVVEKAAVAMELPAPDPSVDTVVSIVIPELTVPEVIVRAAVCELEL